MTSIKAFVEVLGKLHVCGNIYCLHNRVCGVRAPSLLLSVLQLCLCVTLLYLFGGHVLFPSPTMEAQHLQLRALDSQLPVSTLSLGSSVSPGLCILTCEVIQQTAGAL